MTVADGVIWLVLVAGGWMVLLALAAALVAAWHRVRRGSESPRRKDVETPPPLAPPCLTLSEPERRRHVFEQRMAQMRAELALPSIEQETARLIAEVWPGSPELVEPRRSER